MIWNPSTHQHLAGPGEHRKPWGSSWRYPITVNGAILNWGVPGTSAYCGCKGTPREHGQVWDMVKTVLQPAGLLQSQLMVSNHSWSSQGTAVLTAQGTPCVTATHGICHFHTHTLWGPSLEASLWVQLKNRRPVIVKWCMKTHLCSENLSSHPVICSPFPSVTSKDHIFISISIFRTHALFSLFFFYFFKHSCLLYLYLRYMWYEGLILNIYSLRSVCGIYSNLLYIIAWFWLYMTINLLEFIALWLICFHDVLAFNLWILWRVYWGWISHFSFHLHFLFKSLYL